MKTGKLLLLLLALTLLLTIPLVLTFRDLVRAVIVIPLLYLVWLGRLVYLSIPQSLWWAMFLTLALFLTAKSLSAKTRLEPPRQVELTREGRITAWARRLDRMKRGDYFRWCVARDLGQLGLELLAYRARISPGQRDVRREIEKLEAPPEIQAFFQAGLLLPSYRRASLLSRLVPWRRPNEPVSPLDLDPERVVQFLETQVGKQ